MIYHECSLNVEVGVEFFPATLLSGLVPFALNDGRCDCCRRAILHIIQLVTIHGCSNSGTPFSPRIYGRGSLGASRTGTRRGGRGAKGLGGDFGAIFVDEAPTTARATWDVATSFWWRLGSRGVVGASSAARRARRARPLWASPGPTTSGTSRGCWSRSHGRRPVPQQLREEGNPKEGKTRRKKGVANVGHSVRGHSW
ncbi:hypothetical protein VTK26DRAFT_5585 [Humicola hyalothermophila]